MSILFLVGKYDTSDCPVNVMEFRTFHDFIKRTPTTARDAMKLVATGNKAKNDKGLIDTIKVRFWPFLSVFTAIPILVRSGNAGFHKLHVDNDIIKNENEMN